MTYKVRSGLITGRYHLVYGINCQDSLLHKVFELDGENYHLGVVADGCGEGSRSETGAHLATSFVISRLEQLIREGEHIYRLPELLFNSLLEYFDALVENLPYGDAPELEKVSFIKEHLLFTVLGFVIAPKETVIFSLGDGVVVLNDLIDIRDEDNQPSYISYHLVDQRYLAQGRRTLPKKFDTYYLPTADLTRLAVGTDAWSQELGLLLSLFSEHGGKYGGSNVQRTMNIFSKKEKRFKDDAAIIVVQREAQGGQDASAS